MKQSKIYYPNWSELIADFVEHSPNKIFKFLSGLKKDFNWSFDPILSIELLKEMKSDEDIKLTIYNRKGGLTTLQYGDNGYDKSLGYWLADSGNNHCDDTQFPFFAAAVEDCAAVMKTYDGGSPDMYEEWHEKNWKNRSEIIKLIRKAKHDKEEKI